MYPIHLCEVALENEDHSLGLCVQRAKNNPIEKQVFMD